MAHRLTPNDVAFHMPVSSVDKMKVSNATKFCNRAVAAGLRVVASETNKPELITTACFIEDLTAWFEIINNRNEDHALQASDPDAYLAAFKHLQSIARLVHDLRVGHEGRWKPWKSGLVMCTNAIIRLVERLFAIGHKKIYTARCVQDCIESLFSLIRSKQRRPTALQFGRNLKIITLSQYMAPVPNSSYDHDDQEHLLGMSDFITQRNKYQKGSSIQSSSDADTNSIIDLNYEVFQEMSQDVLDRGEMNSLFHISGYILKSLSSRSTICGTCLLMAVSRNVIESEFQKFSYYRANAGKKDLYFPSINTFEFFKNMEVVFRNSMKTVSMLQENLAEKFTQIIAILPDNFHCQNFKMELIRKYVMFRLKSGQQRKQRKRKFDSRSMLV